MRESLHQSEPVNPANVENSLGSEIWKFRNEDIDIKIEDEILPYLDHSVSIPDDLELLDIAFAIDALLISNDDTLISLLKKEDLLPASMFIETTYDVIKDALERGLILKDAPWFELLNNRMISLSLYIAGLTDEKTLKNAREEYYSHLAKKYPNPTHTEEDEY